MEKINIIQERKRCIKLFFFFLKILCSKQTRLHCLMVERSLRVLKVG